MPWIDAGRALQLEIDDELTDPTDVQEPDPGGPCPCDACRAGRVQDLAAEMGPSQPPRRRPKKSKGRARKPGPTLG